MKTSLVVDDSSVVRKVARRMFEKLAFLVEEAEDGLVALEKCKQSFPDVVLLDWNMPNMDGLEFLLALRALPGGNSPKVIFCTTENDMDHITRAISSGADEYIMKPFNEDMIESKLLEVGVDISP